MSADWIFEKKAFQSVTQMQSSLIAAVLASPSGLTVPCFPELLNEESFYNEVSIKSCLFLINGHK